MSDKTSPRPWKQDNGTLAVPKRFIRSPDGEIIVFCDSYLDVAWANAQLIIRAVNSWDNPEDLRARLLELENK